MRTLIRGALLAAIATTAGGVASTTANAQSDANFFKGKVIRVVVGFAPAGGYDFYARIYAQYAGKFIPGNPDIVVQNMGGGGSLLAQKYLYNAAPKDGTVLGFVSQTAAFDNAVAGPSADLDASKFNYVGRLTDSTDLGLGIPGVSNFKGFEDARKREIVMGATGASSTAYLLPAALNKHGGAKFKIITGYKGSNEIMIAIERKEVEAVGSINLAVILSKHPKWIHEKAAPILYQGGLKRHKLLPHVPALPELGISDVDKSVLRAISAAAEIGRAVNAPPGLPADRLKALRQGFDAMVKDPQFIADMKKRNVLIAEMSGEEVDNVAQDIAKMPKATIDLARALVPAAKGKK